MDENLLWYLLIVLLLRRRRRRSRLRSRVQMRPKGIQSLSLLFAT